MTRAALDELGRIVARRTGVSIRPDQQGGAVARFVAARVRVLGLGSAEEYVRLVAGQDLEQDEFSRLVNAVTNQHTFFFRDRGQFEALAGLLRSRQDTRRPMQILSAGCATGEEPYSLAMLCRDVGIPARILATDICVEAVEQARRARFREWTLRRLPEGYRERFFAPDGDMLACRPAVKELVEVERHNLVDGVFPRPPAGRWDWILCRNVLIYFSKEAAGQVVRSLEEALSPEGWVFFGATEQLAGLGSRLHAWPLGATFGYRLIPSPGVERELPLAASSPVAPWPEATPLPPPSTSTSGLYAAIVEKLEQVDASDGIQRLQRLLAKDPEHVSARVTLGNLHLRRHEFAEAVTEYERALALTPLLPEAHYLLGVVHRKLGDLERSAHALRQALFMEPTFWCASFLLAGVEGRLGHATARRRQLRHTLSVLSGPFPAPAELFASWIDGMQDVALDPGEVRRHCRRHLGTESGS